jgi:hypothetical protein
MTPKFWKYLITTCDGSALCLVAESDRNSVEKELENDPRLLSYHAKPQIGVPVTQPPSARAPALRPCTNPQIGGDPDARRRSDHQQHALARIPQTERNPG